MIARSAWLVICVVSVAWLLVRSMSVVLSGAVTTAVLAIVPTAPRFTVAETVYVMLLPTGRFTVSSIFPVPLAVLPDAEPLTELV